MELGIAGRTALVCASTKGLGFACAIALAREGARVILNGRDAATVADAANFISSETGAETIPVAADLCTEEGRASLIEALPPIDILVNNNGGPPPGRARDLRRDQILEGVEANMIAPIILVQALLDGMVERRFGRILNITSASVKMILPGLELSSGTRAGLTGFLAGLAREVIHANVTINNLLPGYFETQRVVSAFDRLAAQLGTSAAQVRAERENMIPARRLGDPDELGAACAFLCSAHAGYITGQNLLIDGGAFPAVL